MTAAPDSAPTAAHDAVTDALLRHRRTVTSVVVVLVGAAALFVALSVLLARERPWTGLTMSRIGEGATSTVTVTAVPQGSPAAAAGLRVGDRVSTLAGIPAADMTPLLALHDRLTPGQVLAIDIVRDGTPATVRLAVGRLLDGPAQWIAVAVRVVVVFALFYGLAALVYQWRPGDPRALLFMLVSAAFGTSLLMMVIPGGISRPPETVLPLPDAFARLNVAGVLVVSTCGLLAGPLLLHFVLLFPRPRLGPVALRTLLGWSYLLQPLCASLALPALSAWLLQGQPARVRAGGFALIAVVAAVALVVAWRRLARPRTDGRALWQRPTAAVRLAVLAVLFILHGALVVVAVVAPDRLRLALVVDVLVAMAGLSLCLMLVYPIGAVVGLWSSWTFADASERQQIRWPLLGLATTLTTAIVLSVGATVWSFGGTGISGQFYTVVEIVTWIAYSLIPLSFAMAILRYGLMDIRVIVRLTFLYAVSSVALVVGAGALVLVLAALMGEAAGSSRITTVLLTLMIVGIVEPVRRRVQRAIDVRFYQQAPDPTGVLARHGEVLRELTRREDLERRLVAALQEAIPHQPTFAFRARDGRSGFDAVTTGAADVTDLVEATRWLDAHHATLHGPLLLDQAADGGLRVWQRLDIELLLPIRHADTLHVVIALGRKRSDDRWSERDLELLSSIAAQTSMAIGGLQTRLRDASLREAFDNQQALLPQQVPQPRGYSLAGAWHPALAVGGDYYDAWWLSEDALAVCIADVSGKGLPASLVMANLQATVKALARPDVSPAALCTRVNQTMAANLRRNRFVTFFFGILWAEQHRFTFANAGHNPPLLVLPQVTRELGLGDPALGLRRQHDYRDAEVQLEPGTRLLLFTDGITEGRSPAGEEFGAGQLTALVARPHPTAPALRDDVLSAIAAWTQGQFDDDVTLLAVVRQG